MIRKLALAALVALGGIAPNGAFAWGPVPSKPLAQTAAGPAEEPIVNAHGYALYRDMKYPAGFDHFDYVNPDAPKGGTLRQAAFGSYDSFNAFALRGTSALNIFNFFLVNDSLMRPSADEISVAYCLVCESITVASDYSWAEFKMRPEARWHDGTPITPEDVVFSFETMSSPATLPAWREGLKDVAKAEATGPHSVRFTFKEAGNRRLPLSVGSMGILPKAWWEGRDFSAPMNEPPLTSGPYTVSKYDFGRSFTLQRVADYWGNDLAVNRGQFNFDTIITDYYRDTIVGFEGFKAGAIDVRLESSQKNWATAYVWPAVKKGEVIKETLNTRGGASLFQGFFFNMRKPEYADPKLREALGYAFDFAWMNKNLFYDMFVRSKSFFGTTSELRAQGLPSAAELALLEPWRGQIPDRVFTTEYNPPDTDGTPQSLRENLRKGAEILKEAGYVVEGGKLISPITHQPVEFEILMWDPAFQLVSNQWAENLKLLGVNATQRTVDFPTYTKIMENFDFDVLVGFIPLLASPGMEIRNIFSSPAADVPSSFNWAGIKDPAVDALVEKMIFARTKPELVAAARALDRVLLWNFYALPHYGRGGKLDMAYWDRFGQPENGVEGGLGFAYQTTWWVDPKKDEIMRASRGTSN